MHALADRHAPRSPHAARRAPPGRAPGGPAVRRVPRRGRGGRHARGRLRRARGRCAPGLCGRSGLACRSGRRRKAARRRSRGYHAVRGTPRRHGARRAVRRGGAVRLGRRGVDRVCRAARPRGPGSRSAGDHEAGQARVNVCARTLDDVTLSQRPAVQSVRSLSAPRRGPGRGDGTSGTVGRARRARRSRATTCSRRQARPARILPAARNIAQSSAPRSRCRVSRRTDAPAGWVVRP